MADEIDAAEGYYALEEKARAYKLAESARNALPFKGVCHNCDDPVGGDRLYCNSECAEDHAWYVARLKQRRLD